MISKEDYEAAVRIVDQYIDERESELSQTMRLISLDLALYFRANYVSGRRIGEFELKGVWDKNYTRVSIIPREPEFDEDYSDDNADKAIQIIGNKYGLSLGFTSDIYSK